MLGRYEGQMVDRAVEAATAQTPADGPTPGERLVASVEASVRAYRRGRAEGLAENQGTVPSGESASGDDRVALVRGLREAAGWLDGFPAVPPGFDGWWTFLGGQR